MAGTTDTSDIMPVTNARESVHARIRKIIKTRGHFPTDEAATKLIWLALRTIPASWRHAIRHWHLPMTQFAILYEDRFTVPNA
jgi:putative transposase